MSSRPLVLRRACHLKTLGIAAPTRKAELPAIHRRDDP